MRAIITGASSGIGRAVAERLAREEGPEARLALVDIAEPKLDELSRALGESGAIVHNYVRDLSDPAPLGPLVDEAVAQLGGLDGVVSNAGIAQDGPLAELALDDYERTFAVNTRATWLLATACRQHLIRSQGSIVITASISGVEPTPPLGAYSASKAAVIMLAEQIAHEWGPDGIRCNCVSPGQVRTGMTERVYDDEEIHQWRRAMIPLRRIGTPDDLAAVISFLLSPDAAYVTGVNILVDGGLHTSLMPVARGPVQL